MKFDFNLARSTAKGLAGAGKDCNAIATLLRKNAGGVGQFLVGDTGSAVKQSLTDWCAQTAKLASQLEGLSTQINQIVNEWEAKELAAQAAAALLSAGAAGKAGTAATGASLLGIVGTSWKK